MLEAGDQPRQDGRQFAGVLLGERDGGGGSSGSGRGGQPPRLPAAPAR